MSSKPKPNAPVSADGKGAPPAAPENGDHKPLTVHCKYDRLVEPGALRFNPLNDNRHPEQQLARLVVVFREVGIRHPVVVSRRSELVVVGEGRARALLLCPGALVPVVDQDFASEEEELAFLAADNKLSALGERDGSATAALIERIKARSPLFNIQATGYACAEITRMISSLSAQRDKSQKGTADAPPPLDKTRELLAKWGVKPGDILEIGRHRLMCGDSGDAESVEALLNGEPLDLCFTSPPYDQRREYNGENKKSWLETMQAVFGALPATAKTQVLVNLGFVYDENEWQPYWNPWIDWMRSEGWRRFGWYVWDQGWGLPGERGRLNPSHEFIFHFNRTTVKPQKTHEKKPENCKRAGSSSMRLADGSMKKYNNPDGSKQLTKVPDSVIRVKRQQGNFAEGLDHPAVFPVEFPSEIIAAYTVRGGTVFDPFMGSGTTFVASENLGRRGFGMEISPAYCCVILERMHMAFPGIRIGVVDA